MLWSQLSWISDLHKKMTTHICTISIQSISLIPMLKLYPVMVAILVGTYQIYSFSEFVFICPYGTMLKLCGGGYLEFPIDTKNTNIL